MRQLKKTGDSTFSNLSDKDNNRSHSANLQQNRIEIGPLIFKGTYISYIFIGIILLICGSIVRAAVNYYFIFEIDANIIRIIIGTAEIIRLFGLMIFILGIIYGALFDDSIHPHIRAGMFIGLGLMISFVATATLPY